MHSQFLFHRGKSLLRKHASYIVPIVLLVSTSLFVESEEIRSPASARSGEPNLTRGADNRLYLSWIETAPRGGARLRFSSWNDGGWSAPTSVASGDNWFVNWADFPSLCALADGTLAAHWLQKSSEGTYSYDVMISLSRDRGKSWSKPMTPHRDGTLTEHGFVSLVPLT